MFIISTKMLIEEYEKYPCLYNVKSKDYQNKQLRDKCLQKILESLQKVKTSVSVEEIKKK